MLPPILDATCGSRMIWFDKDNHDALFFDCRQEHELSIWSSTKNDSVRVCNIDPDVIGDFTHLPFPDESFYMVVFDPPHLRKLSEKAWIRKKYGVLPDDWKPLIHDGFWECMRVLKTHGTLIFKWSENLNDYRGVPVRDVIGTIGCKPLFGTRVGNTKNTIWMAFMKGEQK